MKIFGRIKLLLLFTAGALVFLYGCSTYQQKKVLHEEAILSGCISGNCTNGYGVYIYENGDEYRGYWKNGKRNRKGKYVYGDMHSDEYKTLVKQLQEQKKITVIPHDYHEKKGWRPKLSFIFNFTPPEGDWLTDRIYRSPDADEYEKEKDAAAREANYPENDPTMQKGIVKEYTVELIYSGEWKDGRINGSGTIEYKGKKYQVTCKDGNITGISG